MKRGPGVTAAILQQAASPGANGARKVLKNKLPKWKYLLAEEPETAWIRSVNDNSAQQNAENRNQEDIGYLAEPPPSGQVVAWNCRKQPSEEGSRMVDLGTHGKAPWVLRM